jgi:hypothetical protein
MDGVEREDNKANGCSWKVVVKACGQDICLARWLMAQQHIFRVPTETKTMATNLRYRSTRLSRYHYDPLIRNRDVFDILFDTSSLPITTKTPKTAAEPTAKSAESQSRHPKAVPFDLDFNQYVDDIVSDNDGPSPQEVFEEEKQQLAKSLQFDVDFERLVQSVVVFAMRPKTHVSSIHRRTGRFMPLLFSPRVIQ